MKNTVAKTNSAGKTISFLRDERVDVGVDVHKSSYRVTMWSEARQDYAAHWTQPADPAALMRRLTPCNGHIRRVVYEAGPTGYGLARALRQADFETQVIAPSRTPKSTGQEAKSDRLDSRRLAMWSAKGLLHPVRIPSEEEEADRQLFRLRQQIVAKRRRVKQQIKSFLLQQGLTQPAGLSCWSHRAVAALRQIQLAAQLRLTLDMFLDDLAHYDAQFKKADEALKTLADQRRHRRTARAMQTVPGVGPVTAMAVRTELIAPQRFTRSRQVAAMAGLAPLVSRTGKTVREGPLMKSGNARLRAMLIEAAWRWVANDAWARERFGRLVHNTGEPKKAIAAMARRLIIILWRISVTGQTYRPRPVSAARRKKSQPALPNKPKTKRAPSTQRQRPLSVQRPG
ncbi:MAG: IS110 family transposase [bacterium]|nr:IS110 family transposase [bacterium]